MNTQSKTLRIVLAGLMAALTCVATMIIRIPTIKGYVHIGDCMVIASGIILGPGLGGLAAGIGSMLADLLGGYYVFSVATFVIKFLAALAAGLTFNFVKKVSKKYNLPAVKSNPAIKVLCGKLVANIPMGDEVKVGMWSILGSKTNAPYAVPLDEYGEGGEPINMEQGKTYFVIIPGGTFKNEAGDLNEEITLQYTGTWVEPLFMPTAVDPADGSTLKKIENVYFTFESKPTKAYNCTSKIKLIEGELVDGVPTGKEVLAPADMWNANVSGNKLQVFPADYDSYLTPIPLEAGKEYFLILDAKAVYNSANVYNKQVVVA